MAEKLLKPLIDHPAYYERVEKEIVAFLKREMYLPILRAASLKPDTLTLQNTRDDLLKAISSNTIQYVQGRFEGEFSSAISKQLKALGAEWDDRGFWSLPQSELSPDIRIAIGTSESVRSAMADRLTQKISEIQKKIPEMVKERLKVGSLVETAIEKTNKDFESSIRGIAVPPKFTQYQMDRIRDEYTENLGMYVSDFVKKETAELRQKVQGNVGAGIRVKSLAADIQASYGVSLNKAKFLARQETQLLTTKIRQTRYQEVGINKYKWVCVKMPHQPKGAKYKPGEVRYHHAELDGKVFSWDNPPPVNAQGERKNPGQDYNCRCIAQPIVEF